MRLKLDIPGHWPVLVADVAYEPVPGVTLTIEPLVGTPSDLTAWGDSVVLEGVPRSAYRIRNVEDLKTDRGWPVSIFFSDIRSIMPDADAVVVERRLHALYLFQDHCGVAVARTRTPARFDAVMPELRRTLLTGDLDWSTDDVLALSDVWRGLDIEHEPAKHPSQTNLLPPEPAIK